MNEQEKKRQKVYDMLNAVANRCFLPTIYKAKENNFYQNELFKEK